MCSARGDGRLGRRGEGPQGFCIGGAGDAAFGEDGGDIAGGGDVEGGVRGVDVGSDADTLEMGDFGGGALFDGNVVAVGDGEIEGGNRRGDVKGDVVLLGENGHLVGADFVGGVAVGGDAVGAGDDGPNFSRFQKVADHVVGDERERDAAFVEFPGGEAGALEIGARFRHKNVGFFALFLGDADDAKRGADAPGGGCAGGALGHNLA